MTEEFYNKLNGLRTTYYNNSKIASEVSYKNGLKRGCQILLSIRNIDK